MERQDLDMEVEEKINVPPAADSTETWTERAEEAHQRQTSVCCQLTDVQESLSAFEAPPEVFEGSDWDVCEKEAERPKEKSSCCERSNATSVIVRVQATGVLPGDAAATESEKKEAKGDNQSVATTTTDGATGKVIVTQVTVNSLTVTFTEAAEAEGFFKGFVG